jgi:hypothetical protein
MIRVLIGLAVVSSFPLAVAASPHSGPGPHHSGQARMVEMQDTDHDGFISYGEHDAWGARVFQTMDSDKNGLLTRDEFMAVHMGAGFGSGTSQAQMKVMRQRAQTHKAELFTAMDGDHDGVVGGVEFFIKLGDGFMNKDKNKDGHISVDEFREWHRGW